VSHGRPAEDNDRAQDKRQRLPAEDPHGVRFARRPDVQYARQSNEAGTRHPAPLSARRWLTSRRRHHPPQAGEGEPPSRPGNAPTARLTVTSGEKAEAESPSRGDCGQGLARAVLRFARLGPLTSLAETARGLRFGPQENVTVRAAS
jgi:hypothetical protein